MTILEIVLIGVALAMDASALTIANCATYKGSLDRKKELAMPVAFALFQFLMPVIGFYIGSLFSEYLANVSKFVTAGIFFILGAKIVFDNVMDIIKDKRSCDCKDSDQPVRRFTIWVLLLQAVATSIDALAIGVTFAVELSYSIFIAGAIIGGVTLVIGGLALLFGKYLGKLFGKYAEWLGAVILIALAIKNLVEAIIAL